MKRWLRALRARGPEQSRICDISGVATLGFTRLAINGLRPEGMQPFIRGTADTVLAWMCNGEIYNWRDLAAQYGLQATSGSDCEIIGPLYEEFCRRGLPLTALFSALDGVFAAVIVDRPRGRVIVARDPYGVRPLYIGQRYRTQVTSPGVFHYEPMNMIFGSEIKSLYPLCEWVTPFPPGQFLVFPLRADGTSAEMTRYHTIPTLGVPAFGPAATAGLEAAKGAVREALTSAVRKRMLTERPVAALLSGGVDSSLIAALVAAECRRAGAAPLRTFSIGMEGSTDLHYARLVAAHIQSDHTEIVLTADDFFAAVPTVIETIESYDTTTVRASVGNWLVAKAIKERSDCKVVFNGDGSDEIWGSYLYFYNAPSDAEFEEEVTRLLTDIHMFDVLRSDRSISSHGLEPRTPFLDKQVVATARAVATEWRRPVRGIRPEKWLMRAAFDDGGGLLPREVLWRQKEAFSDGVSGQERSWYQIAQEKAEKLLGANWKETAERLYTTNVPATAEQAYYRQIYESYYGRFTAGTNVPYFWMPRWCAGATDPSARTLAVYGGGAPATSAAPT